MIFYYTGTGNSKYAAEKLLAVTGGELYSIAGCEKSKQYEFSLAEGELLGFVFPVYCYSVPMTVREFVAKLKISGSKDAYSYVVANCGETTGKACQIFSKFFPVSAMFGLPMVDNYLPFQRSAPDRDQVTEALDKADRIMEEILQYITKQATGNLNRFEGKMSGVTSKLADAGYVKGRSTKDFSVTDRCISCGKCAEMCPVSAIALEDGKPIWVKPKCDLCFGCLHRCPAQAIEVKNSTVGKGRYLNPRVEI